MAPTEVIVPPSIFQLYTPPLLTLRQRMSSLPSPLKSPIPATRIWGSAMGVRFWPWAASALFARPLAGDARHRDHAPTQSDLPGLARRPSDQREPRARVDQQDRHRLGGARQRRHHRHPRRRDAAGERLRAHRRVVQDERRRAARLDRLGAVGSVQRDLALETRHRRRRGHRPLGSADGDLGDLLAGEGDRGHQDLAAASRLADRSARRTPCPRPRSTRASRDRSGAPSRRAASAAAGPGTVLRRSFASSHRRERW